MKLLLTSAGITNNTLANALREMTGRPFGKQRLAFIPTAANVEPGDKGWLIQDYVNFQKLKFSSIDIVDISALPRDIWNGRLKEADVLVFGGGNSYYLMYWINKLKLKPFLKELLKTRVYVGISAGSIITSINLSAGQLSYIYSEDTSRVKVENGLGFVDFQIRPHLNSPFFPKARDRFIKKLARKLKETVYAIDDQSAVKVVDGKVEIVGEGKHLEYNNG